MWAVKEQEDTLAYLEPGFSVLPALQKDLGSYLKISVPRAHTAGSCRASQNCAHIDDTDTLAQQKYWRSLFQKYYIFVKLIQIDSKRYSPYDIYLFSIFLTENTKTKISSA